MLFNLRCKVCGQIVAEKDIEEHFKSHDPSNYFDVIVLVGGWNKTKKE